jgi:hypothetical protein
MELPPAGWGAIGAASDRKQIFSVGVGRASVPATWNFDSDPDLIEICVKSA